MAIDAYTGLPGSGKSHTVVQHVVLPALKESRCVVTNIPMKREAIEADYPGADLRVFDVQKFEAMARHVVTAKNETARKDAEAKLQKELDGDLPEGCVWVLDEVWRLWPAGQKTDKVPEPFKAMLAEHRHRVADGRAMQIALVTQDLAQIGKFARDLVETTYRTEKLGALGLTKRFRVDVYRGGVAGARPPASLMIRQTFGRYSTDVWKYYESHTKRQGEGSGADESKVDKRGLAWKRPLLWLGLPLAVVALVYGVYGTWRFFNPVPVDTKGREVPKVQPLKESKQRQRQVSAGTWRITAVYDGPPDLARVYLEDGTRAVDIPVRGYCDKDIDGFFICEFEGQRFSNQFRRVERPVPVATLSSVLGVRSEAPAE